MKVYRIYMDNPLRNYCHLVACEQTKEAIIIDPFDAHKCIEFAEQKKLNIRKIINTHEHFDHIEGNPEIVDHTGAKIYAHANAVGKIPSVDVGLKAGDKVEVGNNVRLRVLDTPGHTLSHVCLVSELGEPALFSGDTLFNASSGNCHYGGNIELMYQTFSEQLATLPDNTAIYPGHDYAENNLKFALSVEPDNSVAKQLLDKVTQQTPNTRIVTTLGLEKQMNPFFRLSSPPIFTHLKELFVEQQPDPKSVFISLRRVRDNW